MPFLSRVASTPHAFALDSFLGHVSPRAAREVLGQEPRLGETRWRSTSLASSFVRPDH